jgi:hypothetical protein
MRNIALRMTDDELRAARLLFDAELSEGLLTAAQVQGPVALTAVRAEGIPPSPLRVLAQVRYKLGERTRGWPGPGGLPGLDYERSFARPQMLARRELLGDRASRPPRFLVRVDEFPHFRVWDDPDRFGTARFERFHEILAGASVSYLVAVLPRVSRQPLSPSALGSRQLEDSELAMVERLRRERVAFALHGRDHRTRFSPPRRRSELCGLSLGATAELIEAARAELAGHGLHPAVFVPPFNRFDAPQLSVLARTFAVVCGGPESIGQVGFQATPQWRAGTVYLPAYAPFYGRAGDMLSAARAAIDREAGLWVPLVLHWEWERQAGWRELEQLAALIAPYTVPWEDFLAAVRRSAALAHADLSTATPGEPL